MRPAQKAPENILKAEAKEARAAGFNEAGAKSAGKPSRGCGCTRKWPRFNEAGAKSAGKPLYLLQRGGSPAPSFNEAGAKSAGKLPMAALRDLLHPSLQ